MKFLGNPWIVGLLGLGAMVVVIFNTFHPHGSQIPLLASGSRMPAGIAVNSPPAMPGSNDHSSTPAPVAAMDIDLDFVRSHLTDWLSVTQHDPFFTAKAVIVIATNAPVHEIGKLKLKAIWRQDGIAMAAIDNGIFRLGDDVEGRRLQRIDHNGVWLEYNGKKEFIIFDNLDTEAATNTP